MRCEILNFHFPILNLPICKKNCKCALGASTNNAIALSRVHFLFIIVVTF